MRDPKALTQTRDSGPERRQEPADGYASEGRPGSYMRGAEARPRALPGSGAYVPEAEPLANRGNEDWSWEQWGRRSEQEWRSLDRWVSEAVWAGIGALMGAGVAAIPLFYLPYRDYPLAFWQPMGAAVGAVIGLAWGSYRWRKTQDSAWRRLQARRHAASEQQPGTMQ